MAYKKICKIVAIVITLIAIMMAVGCGDNTGTKAPEQEPLEYALNHTELTLFLDETCDLTVENNVKGKQVAFGSTNVRSVTVSSEGKITAVAIGSATVYAEIDGKTLTCAVTVTIKEEGVPFIDLENEKKTSGEYVFNLPVGDEYRLNPVLIDGRAIDGVNFNLTCDNEKLEISGLTIKATEVVCSATVKITCSYKSVNYELSVKVNAVNVG